MKEPTFYSLQFLRLCGLHPYIKPKFFFIYYGVALCCQGFIFSLALIGVLTTIKSNFFHAIDNLQTVFIYAHIIGKYMNMYLNRSKLAELMDLKRHFWALEDFDWEIRRKCEKILEKTSKFIFYFIIIVSVIVLNFYLQPFISGEMPVSVYVPEGWFYRIYFVLWFLCPCVMGGIYGADTAFCSICIPTMVQFKLIAHQLQDWSLDRVGESQANLIQFQKKLKSIVDHQNFLIDYCHKIEKFTKNIFVIQVFTATAIVCMQLFVTSRKEFLLPTKLKCSSYCIMAVVQSAIFCFNAELLSVASEEVANAAYNSLWYDAKVAVVQKSIQLLITRSHKPVLFSGCGLVWINLKTFTQMFKTALTFFSYLNTMVKFDDDE